MNKPILLALSLLTIILVLTACDNTQSTKSLVQDENKHVGTEKESNHISKDLPEFNSMEKPSFKRIDSDMSYRYSFDHAYTEVCWNNCNRNYSYNHMDIHSGDVEVGDKLQVDWHHMKPLPSEVNLIRVDHETKEEANKENKDSRNSPLDITIGEDMIGKQYAVEFLWKNEGEIQGRSMLTFKFE